MRGARAVRLPIWNELMIGVEMAYLRVSPVYWGWGIPKGNGAAVVVVPAFLGTDLYLAEFRTWLRRIGYKPYESSIGWNAECPNLLISTHLLPAIEKAHKDTGQKVHLVGHSLGGLIARAAAAQLPDRVASVISMGAPLRGIMVHPSVLRAVEIIRGRILERNGQGVRRDCYTTMCTCLFLQSCVTCIPKSIVQTAVYSKADGILDWRSSKTGDPSVDFEVSTTHIGMAFNPLVYRLVADRLALGTAVRTKVSRREARSGKRKAGTVGKRAARVPVQISDAR
jgi:triacylglycerol lipase